MPKSDQITTERIKSHLQKYRMHRVKSKKEFISSYETSLRNFQARGGINGVKSISSGEVAAHITFTSLNDPNKTSTSSVCGSTKGAKPAPAEAPSNSSAESPKEGPAAGSNSTVASDALMLPQLTEAEKQSPIGAAMGYLMGLFFSLKQQLMIQRAMEAGANDKSKSPVQDVFNSFVAGSSPSAAPQGPDGTDYASDPSLQHQQQLAPATNPMLTAPATNPIISAPSVRTNIEENSMMKREMQNQMALQNKMRALKQQELNKYKNVEEGGKEKGSPSDNLPFKEDEEAAQEVRLQGAGETAAGNDVSNMGNNHHRQQRQPRGLSIGASEEFWNTDVVDEQLFEFLMNN
jgi:hypothetical protein